MSRLNTKFNRMPRLIFGKELETGKTVIVHNRFPRFFAVVETCPKQADGAGATIGNSIEKYRYEYCNPV